MVNHKKKPPNRLGKPKPEKPKRNQKTKKNGTNFD
jgi:hypothetical protein